MQPDDVQRNIAHIAFTRGARRRIFILRPSPSFSHIGLTLWATHLPFVTKTRDLTSISVSSFFRNYLQGEERTLDAVLKHTLSIGWPNALPNRLFPQTLEEANARHCEAPFHQSPGPRPPIRIFNPFQGLVQNNNWIFEVLFPKR